MDWAPLGVQDTTNDVGRLEASSVVYQRCPKYGAINTTLALLLVNRQLHDEVQWQLRVRKMTYELDIMDANFPGPRMWLSWLCVPAKREHVTTLQANVRLFNSRANLSTTTGRHALRRAYQRFMSSTMSTMSLTYCLFLVCFLQNGPGGNVASRLHYEARFSIGTLIFNFRRPTGVLVPTAETPKGLSFMDAGLFDASAYGLLDWLHSHLRGRGGEYYQDSRILYQGVGEIEIRIDGDLHHHINVTDLFCDLPRDDSVWPALLFDYKWEFEAWVDRTIEKRKRLSSGDETAVARLRKLGELEYGLLMPGLWRELMDDDSSQENDVPA
ncbi:hypothetical protein ACRALDRAFT_2028105 [Sodiomyces alcalophilus JCM 7366]|uniref:uncharacterized protein n=1 Tax=Sodiomyces alcalophilus JCM 7366 TaxID=591952 RepID=UPI0039B51DA4